MTQQRGNEITGQTTIVGQEKCVYSPKLLISPADGLQVYKTILN
jgi:hypothetical protein